MARLIVFCLFIAAFVFGGCDLDVRGPNRAPVAVAGPDAEAVLGISVLLDGSASYDPDGDVLTRYAWQILSRPVDSVAEPLDADRQKAFMLPDVAGVYLVALVVSDGKAESARDVMQIRAAGCDADIECQDGLFCTINERCEEGNCLRDAMDCSADDNDCSAGVCDEDSDACVQQAFSDGTACDDDERFCTGAETCLAGVCTSAGNPCDPPGTCDDVLDSCSGSECIEGEPCDDGLYCTLTDTCSGGVCLGSGSPCAGPDGDDDCNESCDEETRDCLAYDGDGAACDDGIGCTLGTCSAGTCVGVMDESLCGEDEICNLCAYGDGTGCGAAPASLALSCEPKAPVGLPSNCTLLLDGIPCETANIECVANVIPTRLFFESFDTDPDLNPVWTTLFGNPQVTTELPGGDSAAVADGNLGGDWTIETSIDTTCMDVVCLDFDWAHDNETLGEAIIIEFSTNGGLNYRQAIYLDFHYNGTIDWTEDDVLAAWFGNICLTDIDPAAANNSDLRVRITLRSNANDDEVYIDNFTVIGFASVARRVVLFEAFDFDPDSNPDWITISGDPQVTTELPGGNSAAVADGGDWTIEAGVDTSSCHVVDLDFDIAHDNEDNDEGVIVEMSTNGGGDWRVVTDIDFGDGRWAADNVLHPWYGLMRLSDMDPAAAGNADLRIRLTLRSNANTRESYVDNFEVICHEMPDPMMILPESERTDNGDGSYDFTLSANCQNTSNITCTWDNGNDSSLSDQASIVHKFVTKTFGENSTGQYANDHQGVTEDVAVSRDWPDTNYDSGNDSDGHGIEYNSWHFWIRFDISAIPSTATIQSVKLHLFTQYRDGSDVDQVFELAAARETMPGTSWVDSAATWNHYNGTAAWSGGHDGGQGDRGAVVSSVTIPLLPDDRWYTWAFNGDGVSFVQRNLSGSVDLTMYGTVDAYWRQFQSAEDSDGRRPYLEITYGW